MKRFSEHVWVFVVLTLTSKGLQLPGWRTALHVERTSLAPQQQQLVQPRRTLLCYSGATGRENDGAKPLGKV